MIYGNFRKLTDSPGVCRLEGSVHFLVGCLMQLHGSVFYSPERLHRSYVRQYAGQLMMRWDMDRAAAFHESRDHHGKFVTVEIDEVIPSEIYLN